jgi:putative ABC transport system permease protein
MALGARRSTVLQLVAQHALRAAGIGTALGLLAGVAATRLMRGLLYETDPLDPITFAAVPVMVLAITLVATALPAWRAARLDPARMLRAG